LTWTKNGEANQFAFQTPNSSRVSLLYKSAVLGFEALGPTKIRATNPNHHRAVPQKMDLRRCARETGSRNRLEKRPLKSHKTVARKTRSDPKGFGNTANTTANITANTPTKTHPRQPLKHHLRTKLVLLIQQAPSLKKHGPQKAKPLDQFDPSSTNPLSNTPPTTEHKIKSRLH
jgi:hypothetical protein